MLLDLAVIRMDGGTQPRSELSPETVAEYAERMSTGAKFPPVTVFYDGESYWLADGFHRTTGAARAALERIEALIIQGTIDDAKWFSYGANQQHGIRRTNEDKQRSVRAALEHPKSAGLSDSAIARHIGVDQTTVTSWRNRLSASQEIPKMPDRTVTRSGVTYQQNVTNIGKRPTRGAAVSESISINLRTAATVAEAPPCDLPSRIAIPELSKKQVWAAQATRDFTKELLRLIRSFEKTHPPVEVLIITRNNGSPVGVEIVSREDAA